MKTLLIFFAALCGLQGWSQQPKIIEFELDEGSGKSRPVRVQFQSRLGVPGDYELMNQATRTVLPAQLIDSITLVFMSEENLHQGRHRYTLRKVRTTKNPPPVTTEKNEDGIWVKLKQKPLFFYHTREAMPPSDSPSYFRRSGFIHPLYSPAGQVLTDDFPVGHVHQHAIFNAWVNTTFRKTSVDFWNQQAQKGTVEHLEILEIKQGSVVAQVKVLLRHRSIEFGEVLKERWTLTIYPSESPFVFDLESEQQNTSSDTLFLNKYHYGGLAFRGSKFWNSDDKQNFQERWEVLTSEGVRDSAANATHPRWVDASGKVNGRFGGAAVFNHPSNFRYPQAIRVHPVMPYWAFSPVVDGPFFIAPDSIYRSKFRYFVHEGQAEPAIIERYFNDWIKTPRLTIRRR